MKEKILITVKTYPTLSREYAELVCTAGVEESGKWRRVYPVQFRQLIDEQKYRKYQWIEADLEKSTNDTRPESYKIHGANINTLGQPLTTVNKWLERREAFLDKVRVYEDMSELIQAAHNNTLSLAAFRPAKWLRFTHEEVGREWDARKLAILEEKKKQLNFFKDATTVEKELEVVKKLPYKFSYQYEDVEKRTSKLMIEDWEIGALYWNCLKAGRNDEKEAIHKVKTKYWDDFIQSGRYSPILILGTTLEHHNKKAPNPFVIVGVASFPKDNRQKLF